MREDNFKTKTEHLARLMARENINVEFDPKAAGAYFDLKTRTLVFPMYEKLQNAESELIVGHEIGHALETPMDKWEQAIKDVEQILTPEMKKSCSVEDWGKFYKTVLNVVEDARMERKLKDRYPGMRKIFSYGYDQLFNRGVFGDAKERQANIDAGEYVIADLINCHYKIPGKFYFQYDDKLNAWIKRIDSCSSFDDVVAVTNDLFLEIVKDLENPSQSQKQNKQNKQGDEGEGKGSGNGNQSKSDKNSGEQSQQQSGSGSGKPSGQNSNSDSNSKPQQGGGGGTQDQKPQQGNPDQNEGEEQSQGQSSQGQSEEGDGEDESSSLPNAGHEDCGVKEQNQQQPSEEQLGEKVQEAIKNSFDSKLQEQLSKMQGSPHSQITNFVIPTPVIENIVVPFKTVLGSIRLRDEEDKKNPNNMYKGFLRDRRAPVEHYTRTFQMLKRAAEMRRTMSFKTGSLDTNRLSYSQTSDNVFKTGVYVNKGKDHGYVIIIDFSGSMNSIIGDAIKQLLEIVSFCRLNKIPVNVYAFSDAGSGYSYLRKKNGVVVDRWSSGGELEQFKNGKNIQGDFGFALIELFHHSMSTNEYTKMANSLLRSFCNGYHRLESTYFSLGGTPLAPSIMALPGLVENMRKETKAQIIHCILLTDGDDTAIGISYSNAKCHFQDARTKIRMTPNKLYNGNVFGAYRSFVTEWITRMVSATMDDVQIVNFFITSGKRNGETDWYYQEELDDNEKRGFDRFYYVNTKAFDMSKLKEKIKITGTDSEQIAQSALNRGKLLKEQRKMIDSFIRTVA